MDPPADVKVSCVYRVLEICVTMVIELEFYRGRPYKMGNTGSVSLSLRLVLFAQTPVVASLVLSSGCSSQFQGHAIVLNIDFCGG